MKEKLIKLVVILGIIIINLFSCLFLQTASAKNLSDVTSKELTNKLNGTITSNTLDYLQYGAARKKSEYFDFDAKKMVNQAKKVETFGGDYADYDVNNKSVICISPGNHETATIQRIECIMDVTTDSVIVYSKTGNKIKVKETPFNTKNANLKKAVKYAKMFAYFSYKSVEEGEVKIPENYDNYKCLLRMQLFCGKFDYFKKLGVPDKFNPHSAPDWNPAPAYWDAKVKEYNAAIKEAQYTGRFILLSGYAGDSNNGQNDCIFSGRKVEDTAKLKIKKTDNNGNVLKGATFKIYLGDKEVASGTTNNKGYFTAPGLKIGKEYTVKEVKAPAGYDISNPDTKKIKIGKGTNTVEFANPYAKTNLKINKKDKNNGKALAGVTFTVQFIEPKLAESEKDKYVTSDGSYTTDRTELATNANGEIQINGIYEGKYKITEVRNPNAGYIEYPNEERTITVQKNDKNLTTFVLENEQAYINLSGRVWEDRPGGKKSDPNYYLLNTDEDKNDTEDKLLANVIVRLKDKDGNIIPVKDKDGKNIVQEIKTDSNGYYMMKDVLIDKLDEYYIEFTYNGMSYESVPASINKGSVGNKAIEGPARTTFNENYATIEHNQAFDKDGQESYDLKYDSGNYISTLHYGDNLEYGYEGQNYPINGMYDQYAITATTQNAYDGYLSKIKTPEEIRKEGIKEITDINLGVKEREQPDLALVKDLENVRISINGQNHTYVYGQRYKNQGEYGDGFNVGVKFGSKYGDMSYSRAIYKADYEYENKDEQSKELKVYVTYKLTIKNKSDGLVAQVNSVVDYYDSNYELISVGRNLGEKGIITDEIEKHEEEDYDNDNKYKKTTIQTNTRLEAGKEDIIYVEFALDRGTVKDLINDETSVNNVAEIASYSIFDGDTVYAGIDKNSNPGNAVPGDKKTYEDDTDSSPALKLEVADAREMAGKVFLDGTDAKLMSGQERLGSGKYEDGETGIGEVYIALTENSGSGMVYKTKTVQEDGYYKIKKDVTLKTDDGEAREYTITPEKLNEDDGDINTQYLGQGDFFIPGYIPGNYTLTYTWGDETYTVQNYKGTIYKEPDRQNDARWWHEKKGENKPRYSDAMDNLELRKQIDNEIKTITNQTEITKTKMYSTTPLMEIGVEYETTYTDSMGDKYTYRINKIDFGIVERARQDLALRKRVKTLKATLANGQVIVDLEIDEEGNVTRQQNGITYMGPNPNMIPSNGFIRLELDNELIQGTIVEVGYEIKAINQSEIDYISDDYAYYLYGERKGDIVTIKPTGIIDYLDRDWAFDSNKNPNWQIKTLEQIEDDKLVAETVSNSPELTSGERTILYIEQISNKALEPVGSEDEKSATVMLNVSKMLTTTDEISLDNETEIAKLEKTGGSKPKAIPGNYVPGTGKTESDDSMAETTIVTPATGADYNFILPIMIGVSACVILATGVIFIKKKVL